MGHRREPLSEVYGPTSGGLKATTRLLWRKSRQELYKALGETAPKPPTTLDLLRLDADALSRFVFQRSTSKPTCAGPGCNGCCRGTVPVSVREAKDIAGALTFEQGQAVRAARMKPRTWISRCPLLTTGGVCGIYDRRPVACRLHHSIEDPARCESPGPSEAVQIKVAQGELLLAVVAADGIGDLTPMLAAELEAPGSGAEAFTRAHGEGLPDRIRPTGLMRTVCD